MINDVTKLGPELILLMNVYFLGESDFASAVSNTKREALEKAFTELLELYSTDKNSSTVREYITSKVSGYTPYGTKLLLNGHRGELQAEVKPKNVSFENRIDENDKVVAYKSNRNGHKKGDPVLKHKGKLNGGGNFSDFTQRRLDKHVKIEPMMLVSGFIEGKLTYILEFPFSHPDFKNKINAAVEGFYGKKGSPREPGKYKRSIEFDYRVYKTCPTLRAVWANKKQIASGAVLFNKGFLEFLEGLQWEVIVDEA